MYRILMSLRFFFSGNCKFHETCSEVHSYEWLKEQIRGLLKMAFENIPCLLACCVYFNVQRSRSFSFLFLFCLFVFKQPRKALHVSSSFIIFQMFKHYFYFSTSHVYDLKHIIKLQFREQY